MWLTNKHHDLGGFRDATESTAPLMADLRDSTERASPLFARSSGMARIDRLMSSGARIDAALELITLELPQWQLRRIAYDEGEWHCALSRTRELADWLDDSVEGHHTDLALAILDAFKEARQRTIPSGRPSLPVVRQHDTLPSSIPLCCENFS
jgi:hypothetical protein